MKIQLNPGTRLALKDGTYSEYGGMVEVSDELGLALTTGPNPSASAIMEPPSVPPMTATRRKGSEQSE